MLSSDLPWWAVYTWYLMYIGSSRCHLGSAVKTPHLVERYRTLLKLCLIIRPFTFIDDGLFVLEPNEQDYPTLLRYSTIILIYFLYYYYSYQLYFLSILNVTIPTIHCLREVDAILYNNTAKLLVTIL